MAIRQGVRHGRGGHAQSTRHAQTVAHVQPNQRQVDRAGDELDGLHRMEARVERAGGRPAVESFFASLKKERVHRKTCPTRDDARADIFDYIEAFYNSRRRHSTLGQISPMEFERTHAGLA